MEVIAVSMGFLGSMHCLGMCGPIAFALPVRTQNPWLKLFKYGWYNLGRITTYSVMGLLVGLLGSGFTMAGFQPIVSIISGAFILLSVLIVHFPLSRNFETGPALLVRTNLKNTFTHYFQKKGMIALFVLG